MEKKHRRRKLELGQEEKEEGKEKIAKKKCKGNKNW